VIVPQGVLFGSGKAFVQARKKIVEEAELKAVITMPSGVFKPYAGVSTAILLFTKGGATTHTWFYEMSSDGYSLDDKRNKLEGNGDLQDIVYRFRKRNLREGNDRTQKFFFVSKEELRANSYDLSLNKYKEMPFEHLEYETPSVIINKLVAIEQEITRGIKELERTVP
jgi:type I restriction enzyme M protein